MRGRVARADLAGAVQIVLSERSESRVANQGALSPRTWRVADMQTKHALLRASLGWGNMPEHVVRDDVKRGRLVRIRPDAWADDELTLTLSAVYKTGARFGPAHRWILENVGRLCTLDAGLERPPRARAS